MSNQIQALAIQSGLFISCHISEWDVPDMVDRWIRDSETIMARYQLVESKSMKVQENGVFVTMIEQPLVCKLYHKFGRIHCRLGHWE